MCRGHSRPRGGRGWTLAEACVALALIAIALLLALPALAELRSTALVGAAARELALTFQAQRWNSVARNRAHGLWFVEDEAGWCWYLVQDGNGNGLRRAELERGTDRCLSGPHRPGRGGSPARLGFPDSPPAPPAIPPRSGVIDGLDDPVQFGRSDVVSFAPLGSSSSGTVYLTDGRRELWAIVLFGPTARVRVWRLDPRERRWRL